MEKQELKSKWDELAREIGAEIPPETQQREEAVSQSGKAEDPQPTPATETATTVRPSLPKKAAGWDSLAGELGLPPVEFTAPSAEEPPPKPQQRETPGQPQSRGPKREQRAGREPSTQRRESSGQRREPSTRSEPSGERREASGHRRESGKRREAPEKRREPRDRSADQMGEPRAEPPKAASPPATREQPAKPSAVSLWHKIFGSPAEQTAKLTETSTDDMESTETAEARRETQGDVSGSSIRSLSGEDVPVAEIIEELDRGEGSTVADEEAAPDEARRGRPRRRRRGGRGRKSEDRRGDDRPAPPRKPQSRAADQLGDEFDDISDDIEDLASEVDALESESLDSDTDVDDTDIDDTDADLGAGRATRARSAAQRAIPSWDEAIGFIVDSNMQSRSQRRPPSRSDSRGNSSRGRSRGRRKS